MDIGKRSKGFQILFLITVLAASVFGMYDMVFTPVVATLYEMFPQNTGIINFSVSGVSFIIIIISPLAAKVCNRWGAKRLLVIGTFLGAASGLLMGVIKNALWISAMRAVSVAAYPLVQVSAMALIGLAFSDDSEKEARYVGYFNTAGSAVGAIMSLLAGFFATKSPMLAFNAYWIYVPLFVMSIFFIPSEMNIVQSTSVEETENVTNGAKGGYGKRFWMTLISYGIFMLAFAYMQFYVSMYVSENVLGTEAFVGTLNSIMTVSGLISGVLFGAVYKKVGKMTGAMCFGAVTVCIAVLGMFPSTVTAICGYAVIGFCFTWILSFEYAYSPSVVPEARRNDAVSYVMVFQTIAYCLCSYIVTWLMGVMNTDKASGVIMVMAAVAGVATVFEIITHLGEKKVEDIEI